MTIIGELKIFTAAILVFIIDNIVFSLIILFVCVSLPVVVVLMIIALITESIKR